MTQLLEQARFAGDFFGLVTFSVAFVIAVSMPTRSEGRSAPVTKWLLATGIALYVLVTASDVATHLNITDIGEPIEDYLETLFPLVALGVVFAIFASEQYSDVARTRKALKQSHDLMMDIVDGAPAGIMFLDTAGHIAFANDAAKEVLDLLEDEGLASITGPGWVLKGVDGAEADNLSPLLSNEPFDGRPVTLEWPNGWAVNLRVSGRPLSDHQEKFGGIVVTFELV
jgi:PAS domain-containing protein